MSNIFSNYIPSKSFSSKRKERRTPYYASLKCSVKIIFKTRTLAEYYHPGLNVEIPQKSKGLKFIIPNKNSIKFCSYKPDEDGNYYVFIARAPKEDFESVFADQIFADDYDGTVDANDVNFWFDPLEIDFYIRLLKHVNNNTTHYYKIMDDGSVQSHYSHYRGDLE